MGVLYQYPVGGCSPRVDAVEGPREQGRRKWSASRLVGRVAGGTRFRRDCVRLDSISSPGGGSWRRSSDRFILVGIPRSFADGSVPVIPIQEFHRRQPSHAIALCGAGRCSRFSPPELNSGAGLLTNGGGGHFAAL